MKLVLRICSSVLASRTKIENFATVICDLRDAGHRIIVVHDSNVFRAGVDDPSLVCGNGASGAHDVFPALGNVNKNLASALAATRIPAFGLCGADANIVRLRKSWNVQAGQGFAFGVAEVDSFWLDVISKNGGVPVLANIAASPDGEHHFFNADELAASCAVACDADALIFLSRHEGLRGQDGLISRWFDAEKLDQFIRDRSIEYSLVSTLKACRHALQHGVRRTRILPLSRMDSLSSFYVARIDFGTEVFMTA